MKPAQFGDWAGKTTLFGELDFDQLNRRISTDRYTSAEFQARERELIWKKVWQIVGRADELPEAGDWKEYKLFDESFVVARGNDGKLRGFVNSCRHRGNKLCEGGKGKAKKFTCQYHIWTYGLDGKLMSVARPDLVGPIDKAEHGLVEVPVDTFSGFIFLNPDRGARPLAECLGKEVMELLAPYRLEEMVPVGLNVRETLECNWKVILDAFSEGYHIVGVHPELLNVIVLEPEKNRFGFFGDHAMACAPFEVNVSGFGPEKQIEGIRQLPGTFPTVAEVLPRFEELVAAYRKADGELDLPEGVTVRRLLQQATRDTVTAKGLDVIGLGDEQMSDNQGWFLFPNFFMTIRAGEATTIMAYPHPDGDPNRCVWEVVNYMWLPPQVREQYRAPLTEVEVQGSYPYFLALQQDYDQMQRQQKGLRNSGLTHLSLAREEVNVARFHQIVDQYVAGNRKA
jgi:phenylpropionate dioxygenase-like ring-hydroxylating dioxygenase large terminal subunit